MQSSPVKRMLWSQPVRSWNADAGESLTGGEGRIPEREEAKQSRSPLCPSLHPFSKSPVSSRSLTATALLGESLTVCCECVLCVCRVCACAVGEVEGETARWGEGGGKQETWRSRRRRELDGDQAGSDKEVPVTVFLRTGIAGASPAALGPAGLSSLPGSRPPETPQQLPSAQADGVSVLLTAAFHPQWTVAGIRRPRNSRPAATAFSRR